MPSFESPLLYIDFARLPPPDVIETIDFEEILTRYQGQVRTRKPDLAAALALEQSPTNVVLQAQSYGEMILRSRINAAARAVMLPFSKGADLDNLAAFFNVQRMVVTPATTDKPAVMESDERLLKRVRVACEAFSTAGTAGSYIFHAMAADPTIRDVSAIKIGPGSVKVSIMNTGSDPEATHAQIDAVFDKLSQKNIKPLTDVVNVSSVRKIEVNINAQLDLYPGPDASLVMADVQKAMTRMRDNVSMIGRDLSIGALNAALMQSGVRAVSIASPSADVVVAGDEAVWLKTASVTVAPFRSE